MAGSISTFDYSLVSIKETSVASIPWVCAIQSSTRRPVKMNQNEGWGGWTNVFMFWEGVELYPVLEPGDMRSRLAPGNTHEADLPPEVEHLPVSSQHSLDGPLWGIFTGSGRTWWSWLLCSESSSGCWSCPSHWTARQWSWGGSGGRCTCPCTSWTQVLAETATPKTIQLKFRSQYYFIRSK